MSEKVLIVGAGPGLSASLARLCNSKGMKVVLASRNIEKLKELKKEINAETIECDFPIIRLNKVDLPTLGRPTIAITFLFIIIA